MNNEINNTDLLRALNTRADREHAELLRVMQRNHKLNDRFQSLNDELDRMTETPKPRTAVPMTEGEP
jgi:hypothetical protein